MTSGTLLVISAPSGAGKTSLVRALVKALPDLRVSVSHTTRARRPGEREGRDYFFVSGAEFEAMIAGGALLEHAFVFDHRYGTSRAWVEETLGTGLDVVLEIDWQGARQVREALPGCVTVEVLPPSLEALEQRLRNRGQDSDAVIARRMRDAVEEIRHYAEFDYLVVNEDFEAALAELVAIASAERARTSRRRHDRAALLEHLLGGGPRRAPGRRPVRRRGAADAG